MPPFPVPQLTVKFAGTSDLVAHYPGRFDPAIPPSRWCWGRARDGEWVGIFGNWPDLTPSAAMPAQASEPSTARIDAPEAILVIEYPDESLEVLDGWWAPEQCVEVYAGLKGTTWWDETNVDLAALRSWCEDGLSWEHADHIDDNKRKLYKYQGDFPPTST